MNKLVGCIVINTEGKLLILNHVKWDGITPPSGKVEEGEGWIEACKRELWEEVDVVTSGADLKLINSTIRSACECMERTMINTYILDKRIVPEACMNREPEKHTDMRWLSVDEIKEELKNTKALRWFDTLMEKVDLDYLVDMVR